MMDIHTGYLCNPDNYQKGRAQPVSYLVYHYVGGTGGAEANARYFHNTAGTEASAHYFVDHAPSAEIWQSVPEGNTAWHCGAKTYRHPACRNANSIGIEMCCHQRPDGTWYIDEGAWANFKKRLEGETEMTYYKTIGDVPADYRPAVQKLLDKGALKGYGDGTINISEDLCRTVTILDRLGLIGK